MKILVFTEGTIIMHKDEKSIGDFNSHVKIGDAPKKITQWKKHGATIFYMTSRTKIKEIGSIRNVLKQNNFPEGELLYRKKGEEYSDIAERIMPDILVEDDCASIGADEMTYPKIKKSLKSKIKSVVVKEFKGIDHLPNDPAELFKLS
jgi:hypothetical protein